MPQLPSNTSDSEEIAEALNWIQSTPNKLDHAEAQVSQAIDQAKLDKPPTNEQRMRMRNTMALTLYRLYRIEEKSAAAAAAPAAGAAPAAAAGLR